MESGRTAARRTSARGGAGLSFGTPTKSTSQSLRVLAATVGALEELGHQAIACNDPMVAPELLDQHPAIDLVVTDVLMPVRTGPEMIAALDPRHAHLAVLFVTGFAGEAGEFGGHHVLRKPFTLVGLEQSIAEAMSRHRPAAPQRIAAE